MSLVEYDVIIIGAGVAGLTAGTLLAEKGKKVALVTAGEPTACLSTGCIDLCSGADNPEEAIDALPAQHPFHLVTRQQIHQAVDDFKRKMAGAGLPYVGQTSRNRLVLSAIGTFKTTCLIPESMQASPQSEEEKIHVVTFAGLKDFYPGYIISRLKNASFSTYDAGISTTMGIASLFEDENFLESFLLWVEKQNIREDKIAFPAVLGLESSAVIRKKIEYRMERPVFEIPTIPPSMPGRRLFNCMKDSFHRAGGVIYWDWQATGAEKSGRLIEAVITESHGRPNSLNAQAFILATGSFVGGGLRADHSKIIENIFDLPVYTPGKREEWFEQDYFSLNHPIGRAGIVVDGSFRAVESRWDNLYVCGNILAHIEVLKNGCGHGFALATARAAAESLLEAGR